MKIIYIKISLYILVKFTQVSLNLVKFIYSTTHLYLNLI